MDADVQRKQIKSLLAMYNLRHAYKMLTTILLPRATVHGLNGSSYMWMVSFTHRLFCIYFAEEFHEINEMESKDVLLLVQQII